MLQPTVQEFLNLVEGRSLYVPEDARTASAAAADGQLPAEGQQEAEQAAAPNTEPADQSEATHESKGTGATNYCLLCSKHNSLFASTKGFAVCATACADLHVLIVHPYCCA